MQYIILYMALFIAVGCQKRNPSESSLKTNEWRTKLSKQAMGTDAKLRAARIEVTISWHLVDDVDSELINAFYSNIRPHIAELSLTAGSLLRSANATSEKSFSNVQIELSDSLRADNGKPVVYWDVNLTGKITEKHELLPTHEMLNRLIRFAAVRWRIPRNEQQIPSSFLLQNGDYLMALTLTDPLFSKLLASLGSFEEFRNFKPGLYEFHLEKLDKNYVLIDGNRRKFHIDPRNNKLDKILNAVLKKDPLLLEQYFSKRYARDN